MKLAQTVWPVCNTSLYGMEQRFKMRYSDNSNAILQIMRLSKSYTCTLFYMCHYKPLHPPPHGPHTCTHRYMEHIDPMLLFTCCSAFIYVCLVNDDNPDSIPNTGGFYFKCPSLIRTSPQINTHLQHQDLASQSSVVW